MYNNRQILFENMYKNDDVNIINIIKDKIDIIDEYLKIINKIKVWIKITKFKLNINKLIIIKLYFNLLLYQLKKINFVGIFYLIQK